MENSMTSMSKALSSKTRIVDSPEESSWTFYFEDFLCEQSSFSSEYENPSLVSDAASLAAKKFTHNDPVVGFSLDRSHEKLGFRKRRTKGAIVDDALEDTASSPVNSPEVSYLSQLNMKQKVNNNTYVPMNNGGTSSGHTDEFSIVGRDSDYTKLKKKGLCLVPVSTFTNSLT